MRASIAVLLALGVAGCGGPEPNPKSADPYERYLGAKELALEATPASMTELVGLLADPHYLAVTGALEGFASAGSPDFLQHAVPGLRHPHPMVRSQACATIAAIRNPDGIGPVTAALKDPDVSVRRAAVKSLASFAKTPSAVKALVPAVGDKDPGVSLLAHEALEAATGRTDVTRSPDAWAAVLP